MKRFIVKTLLVGFPLIVLLVYIICIRKNLELDSDFRRMDYLPFDRNYDHRLSNALNRAYTHKILPENICSSNFDIFIIGDSFTLGAWGAPVWNNCSYHNYLAKYSHLSVGFLQHDNKTAVPEKLALSVLNTGCYANHTMIVESVERDCISRLTALNFKSDTDIVHLLSKNSNKQDNLTKDESYHRTKLLKHLQLYCQKHLHKRLLLQPLKRNMFTCKREENNLYFLDFDVKQYAPDQIQLAIKKLDTLHSIAASHGINLIYMIAPNKYNIYQNEILCNPYPADTLLNNGGPFDTIPYFFNVKPILQPLIDKGIKDIYYCDDTHWSSIAAEAIGKALSKKINNYTYQHGFKKR